MNAKNQTKNIYDNLISFEGIEGAGKTTQIQLFKAELLKNGFNVHYFREPGGTITGEKLRELILNSKEALHPMTECYIFLAARNELLQKKILPLLAQNHPKDIIILDKSFVSE